MNYFLFVLNIEQMNGFDCGIFTILHMEYLVSKINNIENNNNIETYLFDDIDSCIPSQSTALNYRKTLKEELLLLAKEKLPHLEKEINDLQAIESKELNEKTKQKLILLQSRYNTISKMLL